MGPPSGLFPEFSTTTTTTTFTSTQLYIHPKVASNAGADTEGRRPTSREMNVY